MQRKHSDYDEEDAYELERSISMANVTIENQYARQMEEVERGHYSPTFVFKPHHHYQKHHFPTTPIQTTSPLSTTEKPLSSFLKSAFDLAQMVAGIYISFMIMSSYQEQITRTPYGGDNDSSSSTETSTTTNHHHHHSSHDSSSSTSSEFFNFPLFLVFLQCALNALVVFLKLRWHPSEHGRRSNVPQLYFIAASFAYVVATSSSNTALLYVNYPTQVLAKSCKMIPVMLMGMLVARKKYEFSRIVAVIMTTIGISVFMIDRFGHKHSHDGPHDNNIWGLILLVISLAADGSTNSIQDLMKSFRDKPTGDELMLYMNSYATIFVAISMFYYDQFFPAVSFCIRHTVIIYHIILFCVAMTVGQFFIFWCIAVFGTLELSIITTTRKFFTILWSVFRFGHEMSFIQWLGVLIVFTGLMYDIVISARKGHKKSNQIKEN
ncbi:hypothetical protein FDP41_006781 [Naegleria fowleri]|uniref:Sugar phosphate transporter domain-containing protein n=1 Tax=Naegleria fowleri TaxID=5763 RepID=A0A6A5BI95_NAEFO|nr:uncharacterized protein FDP41_006781 [Naegleria fowleri]KAF0974171.1 hypothetical protein FDP41_006781 [Naegleria fowleri]